jgi:hypothetical protein
VTEKYKAVRNDTENRIQPTEKRGVSTAMHYKTFGPDNFAPPLLHMEMGLINQAWEDFDTWVDDHVEMIPIDEKAVRLAVVDESKG